jgi:hypothetical protein
MGRFQQVDIRLALLVLLALNLCGCGGDSNSTPSAAGSPQIANVGSQPMPDEITTFCGACHQVPDPGKFARDAWYKEVQRGFNFYVDSGRSDLKVPPMAAVVEWYRENSPETLPAPAVIKSGSSTVTFERQPIPLTDGASPMVAEVLWDTQLRVSDMGTGIVSQVNTSDMSVQKITQVANACRSVLVDLNVDGITDMLVSDLGSRTPSDHGRGVLWFYPGVANGFDEEHRIPLLKDVGRIVDSAPGDFDGDGDLDLIVAEFGWLKTGAVWLLENRSVTDSNEKSGINEETFQPHRIDPRHGAITVTPCDINSDGKLDFVGLIRQEFETIDAFLGNGDLTFRRETLMVPQDPSFGSCSMDLADVDSDGDLDAIYCNGDNLDSMTVKDYHGVHLLENQGKFPFALSRLLTLPGASDAAVADLDGDGDKDIAVSGFMPPQLYPQVSADGYDSLCWLEQINPLQFEVRSIEVSLTGHLSLTSGDFDADGDVDLAAGNYPGDSAGYIWWNRRIHSASLIKEPR